MTYRGTDVVFARVCDPASRFDSSSERNSAQCRAEVSKRGGGKIQSKPAIFVRQETFKTPRTT